MRKILLVDASMDGHHIQYIQSIIQEGLEDFYYILILPQNAPCIDSTNNTKIFYYDFNPKGKRFLAYNKYLKYIHNIYIKENCNYVHFLDGDTIMKYMAINFGLFNKNVIVTFHNYYKGYLRKISYKRFSKLSHLLIVHTDRVKQSFNNIDIKNVKKVNYPAFIAANTKINNNLIEIKQKFCLPYNKTIVGLIGGISSYKGIDLILEAVPYLNDNICIFLAGKIVDFDKDHLLHVAELYSDKLVFREGWLSDIEYLEALYTCKIVLLPYRDNFYGASGPLADAAWLHKTIVTSDAGGGITEIITDNHLGFTFKSNNIDSLISLLNNQMIYNFQYDHIAINYIQKLSPTVFINTMKKIYLS